ncbi:MAG: succinate dehydrogenase, cytochrome b556 subunit [Gammaproteobacteria bacterium]|nr:succinate dehydrogenase, cytochrome b556 subunit [Gammaproteobacteria bacterium]
MKAPDGRPIFLNLMKIQLPITGIVSFAHRISGILLFLAIPYLAYIFDLSLQGPDGFAAVVTQLTSPYLKPVIFLLFWSLLHHLLSGIRFLLIDIDVFVDKQAAQLSANIVFYAGILLSVVFVVANL